jgi:peptidoglycan/LPS O-acetylase OafA/YrhL
VEHIRSLDGVRGIAVLCVVFFHFFPRGGAGALVPLISTGWVGVDLFFVLSGYLITSILYEHRGKERYYRNFYGRRVLRLLPLYYFLFACVAALTPVLRIHWRPAHLVMLLQGSNFVLPKDNSLGNLGPFNFFHLWSLSIEEQFYLIWPWLVGSALERKTLRQICVAGMIAAPALRLLLLHWHVNPWWMYQSLPARMDSLFAGALLALIPLPSLKVTRIVAATSLLVFGWLTWRGHSFFFLSPAIQGIGYSALALLFASGVAISLNPSTIVHRICSWRLLRFYGKYSYGIYLWHYLLSEQFGMLTLWVQRRVTVPLAASITSIGLILLCSTTIAIASYKVIESPFLALKKRFRYRPTSVEDTTQPLFATWDPARKMATDAEI